MSHSPALALASWRDFQHHRTSAISLLAANSLPLLGVLFWGWSTFAIVLIYWFENAIIGVINILKMLCCTESETDEESVPFVHAMKLLFVPFFTFHYGMFCAVHGAFVMLLSGGEVPFEGPADDWTEPLVMLRETGTLWGIVGLAISHLYSFVRNYLIGGEYRRVTLPTLMFQPYARVVVLHLAILFGAFATVALGNSIFVLVILIVGKTAIDLALHLREHRSGSEKQRDDRHDGQNRGNEGFGASAK
ncbi:MAG: DUF6498-containing protein [Planctomycetota bacterium]